MPLLSDKEKLYVERIAAVSRKDKSAVIDVLRACLISGTIELLCGKEEISIPFICDLKISYNDRITKQGVVTDIQMEATPNRGLVDEIVAISDGEETPSEQYFKKGINSKLKSLLDIENV